LNILANRPFFRFPLIRDLRVHNGSSLSCSIFPLPGFREPLRYASESYPLPSKTSFRSRSMTFSAGTRLHSFPGHLPLSMLRRSSSCALVTPDGRCVNLSAVFDCATYNKAIFDHSGVTEFVTYRDEQGRERQRVIMEIWTT
jgi:hypothetical protein